MVCVCVYVCVRACVCVHVCACANGGVKANGVGIGGTCGCLQGQVPG